MVLEEGDDEVEVNQAGTWRRKGRQDSLLLGKDDVEERKYVTGSTDNVSFSNVHLSPFT